ncbi:MAG: hypothetical protein KKG33_14910 [candidate division Zixibacteria bacterium]|nr:hypothetical protein [candidate division Zixibacteria bacterium]MBU1470273.1 hypothetical protein [candidate division Zixibacteria bacterium]MBU2626841.1 hypothetical protein [candidate division Zixibacteria bacterium]
MADGKFGTAINCMDGRVQIPVIEWMKENFGLDYVDMVTEPGPEGKISAGDAATIASIKKRVEISVEKHGSEIVIIVAHHDCAGNPVSKVAHEEQLVESIRVVKSWNLPVRIAGVWLDENWQVSEL